MLRQYTSGQPPAMPKMISLHGSVLFADVSGFTKLTALLQVRAERQRVRGLGGCAAAMRRR